MIKPENDSSKSMGNGMSFLNDPDLDKIAVHLINTPYRYRENIIIPRIMGQVVIKTNEEKTIERIIESCAFKSFMSCVIGNLNLLQNVRKKIEIVGVLMF